MSEQYDSHVMLYNIVWLLMVEDAIATRCFDPDGKRIDVVRYIEQGTGHEYEFHRSRPRHQEHWEWVVGYCHVQAGDTGDVHGGGASLSPLSTPRLHRRHRIRS